MGRGVQLASLRGRGKTVPGAAGGAVADIAAEAIGLLRIVAQQSRIMVEMTSDTIQERIGPVHPLRTVAAAVALLCLWGQMALAEGLIDRFVGEYSGSADVETYDGQIHPRDMSVSIKADKGGKFAVAWTSTTYRDGKGKTKSYEIGFVPTEREGVFSAAMTRNVFGHAVQLNPMAGEPFVWARIAGDTLTVFSLFIDDDGGYEIQQFDRTLADDGLSLTFSRLRDGVPLKGVDTFLQKK